MSAPVQPDLALGRQMTLELYDCDPGILADAPVLEKTFVACAKKAGATVIGSYFHRFEPQGVSGVVIIAESHFTVHAWPEYDYAAVDVFSCSESIDFRRAADLLGEALKSQNVVVSHLLNRGILGNDGRNRRLPVDEKQENYTMSWKDLFDASDAWGLSLSVDVYGIDKAFLSDKMQVKGFADNYTEVVLRKNGDSMEIGEFQEAGGGLSLRCRCGASYLAARFVRTTGEAHVDLLFTGYFEPRTAAELAVRLLGGSHYRMQVYVRR